ncbi:MAG TPA: Hsp20/alpha crystallin family protein [Solirubrobacter sp.]|nr:Hsp20/alpha crystallin family protein [Solirubrobacter sp.]
MPSTLTRWDPFAELAELRTRFERLFEDFDGRDRAWVPDVDVVRDNGHLVVRADVPGMKPEEISIEVNEGILTVSGKHEEAKEEKDKTYIRRERRYGAFTRSLPLPDGVDPKKIKAKTQDGVLEVTVPLPKEVAKQEPIKITPTTG